MLENKLVKMCIPSYTLQGSRWPENSHLLLITGKMWEPEEMTHNQTLLGVDLYAVAQILVGPLISDITLSNLTPANFSGWLGWLTQPTLSYKGGVPKAQKKRNPKTDLNIKVPAIFDNKASFTVVL